MHGITLYLIANPLIGIGLGLLVLLCAYNALRQQGRIAMGMWLAVVVVLFYVYVQVSGEAAEMDDSELVAPPGETP
jgi:ABC-type spermidine/putrescine transport system permease subunit II